MTKKVQIFFNDDLYGVVINFKGNRTWIEMFEDITKFGVNDVNGKGDKLCKKEKRVLDKKKAFNNIKKFFGFIVEKYKGEHFTCGVGIDLPDFLKKQGLIIIEEESDMLIACISGKEFPDYLDCQDILEQLVVAERDGKGIEAVNALGEGKVKDEKYQKRFLKICGFFEKIS